MHFNANVTRITEDSVVYEQEGETHEILMIMSLR